MPNNTPRISIVVLNWNRAKDTLECMASLEKLDKRNYKLSVNLVDNGSTANSVEIFKRYKTHNFKIQLIINKENLGYAAGNNIGMRKAINDGSDFVMVLNNDTFVHPQLISGLLKTFNEYPNAGIVSPKIYFAKGFEFHKDRYSKNELGKVIWFAGGDIDWNNVYGTNHGVDEIDHGQFDKIREVDFVTGACLMARSKTLEEVGMFDERYFSYFEDTDLSQRMKNRGLKVLYSPYGVIWHKVAQTSKIGGELNDYFLTRNRILFGMRYAPLRSKIALIRESLRLMTAGRKWQKAGVRDFYLGRFGKGSWE